METLNLPLTIRKDEYMKKLTTTFEFESKREADAYAASKIAPALSSNPLQYVKVVQVGYKFVVQVWTDMRKVK
jgi:hypothetical protein